MVDGYTEVDMARDFSAMSNFNPSESRIIVNAVLDLMKKAILEYDALCFRDFIKIGRTPVVRRIHYHTGETFRKLRTGEISDLKEVQCEIKTTKPFYRIFIRCLGDFKATLRKKQIKKLNDRCLKMLKKYREMDDCNNS
jgi:hypothetical protein